MKEIIQDGNETLRKIAYPIDITSLPNPEITKLIREMEESLASQKDGVALAAPQINIPKRVFIISKKAWNIYTGQHRIFINPVILKLSSKKSEMEEGCLSVRGIYGTTTRSRQATVGAYDENGTYFEMGAGGLVAQIFQHEIEHFNGVLFHDHAKNIQKVLLEDINHNEE